ncbi:MAG: hypothetical protein Q9220_004570 [cf. Caloplaca sp. 1 TL-2023]
MALRFRSLCEDLIIENYEGASRKNIEGLLWDTHLRINSRFRKHLAYFRDLKGKKKPVEQRKTATAYLKFIKSSQRFYRSCIQRLGLRYGGIREIQAVARKFRMNSTCHPLITTPAVYWSPIASTPDDQEDIAPEIRATLLQSCQQALIHLGDLSRYRESELNPKGKAKNWGPAIDYYNLAKEIDPSSGIPHNQLAIVYKAQGEHARALYHLYRTLGAAEPLPTALDNLHIQLKKMREAWEQDLQQNADEGLKENLSSSLECSSSLLHSLYFGQKNIDGCEESERKMLGQLVTGLQEPSLETACISRLMLSNIAADFVAGDSWQGDPYFAFVFVTTTSSQVAGSCTYHSPE